MKTENQTNVKEPIQAISRTQEKRERNAEARRLRSMNRQEVSNVVIGPDGKSRHLGGTKFIYHERRVPGNYRTLWNYLNTTAKPNSKRQKALRAEKIATPVIGKAPAYNKNASYGSGFIASATKAVKRLFNRKTS